MTDQQNSPIIPKDVPELDANALRAAMEAIGTIPGAAMASWAADAIRAYLLADRSRRAKAPAQAPELAPDVKDLVERLHDTRSWLADLDYPGVGTAMANCTIVADALSRLSAPPAETPKPRPRIDASERIDMALCMVDAHAVGNSDNALIADLIELRDAIEAATAPAEAKPVAWSVKPLEWRKLSDAKTADTYGCRSIAGFSFGGYFVNSSAYGSRWNFSRLGYAEIEAASEEDAQAAAQADYEQRTNSDIIVHPDPRAKAAEAVWHSMGDVPAKDGFYSCWCETPPQSHPLQTLRWNKARGIWLTSWPITAWRDPPAAPQPLSPGEVK